MAKKQSQKQSSQSSQRPQRSSRNILSLFSFIAIMLLGLALAISFTLGKISDDFQGVANIIKQIAIAIALIIPAFYSYYEARRHKQVWFILWIIALVLVVVFFILPNIL